MVKESIVPVERIENSILLIRGQKVMLDSDLAKLYGVDPKVFNQAVKRNIERFPEDFMFQLTWDEVKILRSQFVTLKQGSGKHSKYLPYAFTEQGIAMLSGVLRSKRAVEVNIQIMRAFVQLRKMIASNIEFAKKLDELEKRIGTQDVKIKAVFDAMKEMMLPPKKKKNPIGFKPSNN